MKESPYKGAVKKMKGPVRMNNWLQASYRMKSIGVQELRFHSHTQYEIYYFHSGNCKYLINHTIYDLRPGDIIIMDGLTAHRANPSLQDMYERSVVHFSPDWILPLLESLHMPELLAPFKEMNNSLLRGGEDGIRENIIACIKRLAILSKRKDEKEPENQAEMKVLLTDMLVQIFKLSRAENESLSMEKSDKDVHVEKIAEYIHLHFREKIMLDDLSDSLNISKFYLSRIFKEITGMTVMDYVMECRLNQVKYDLEMNPNKKLSTIAHESGFESPAHFSRFIKRKLGMTPTEYRYKKIEATQIKGDESNGK